MTAEQLRNSILQEAISGRLVPQDPNDEPASALLARIREEKARLVKAKQISKRDFEVLPITEDDVDYEIPTSWEWVRLGDIFKHSTGKALNEANKKGTLQDYITTSNVYWGYFKLDKLRQMYYTEDEKEKCMATKGDLLVLEGGDVGRAAIWDRDYDIFLQNHIHKLRAYVPVCTEFYYYCLYLFHDMGLVGGKGIGIQGLSSGALHQIIFPLPPLAEQKRIVAKLEELLPIVEQYGKAQTELDELNTALPNRLRQSILQEAISGRLVPQDPNDEPASVLLQHIREEKARLVKEGKLKKKDLVETPIKEEEIPFEIPSSWVWVKISTLYQTSSGGTPEKGHPEYYGGSIPWVKVGDLKNIYIEKTEDTISEIGLNNSSAKLFPEDTILVAMYCNDAVGKSSILRLPMTTNQAICGLFPNPLLCKEYVYYAIQANRAKLQEHAAGGAQKNINQKIVNDLYIPLPPLAEQQRIVAKIEELFEQIDKITK